MQDDRLALLELEKEFDDYLKSIGASLEIMKSGLFEKQKLYINDSSKRKASLCSRRAGKTHSVSYSLLEALEESIQGDCAYIGLTRGHAKKVMFNHLLKIKKKYGYPLEENRSDLTFTWTNTGNTLYITGAAKEDDTEKLRGLKLKKIVLDEVASFKSHINYLIDEVLEPTTIDLDGSIELIGTPSANPLDDNLFYRATTNKESGWSVHKWTILDNVYIPHAAKWLEQYRERKGWDIDNPIYQREWLGLWSRDTSILIYKYDEARNGIDSLPSGYVWTYVLGVDLGFDDAFAISVLAFSFELPQYVFLCDDFKSPGLIPSKMAGKIIEYRDKYKPTSIVADTGGLGKAIVEEFKTKYRILVEKADKTEKLANIEIVNGDLISGHFKLLKTSETVKEMKTHQWDAEKKNKEDDRTENHNADAALYAFRKCKQHLSKPKEEQAKFGTPEYFEREANRMMDETVKNITNKMEEDDLI